METLIVAPAYGKDYNTKGKAYDAWVAGTDFVVQNTAGKWGRDCGRYVSHRDVGPDTQVEIRYNGGMGLCIIEP